jgi:hypothetical protein
MRSLRMRASSRRPGPAAGVLGQQRGHTFARQDSSSTPAAVLRAAGVHSRVARPTLPAVFPLVCRITRRWR